MLSNYLEYLYERESVSIRLLTLEEVKKFTSKFKDASPHFHKDKYDIYGVIDKEIFIGGIVINKKPDISIYKKHNLKCEVTISFLYLLPRYRKMGIVQKLMNIPMKKYNTIGLTTNKGYTNDAAYKLYKKNNFRIIEERNRTSFWYWSKK